MTYSRWFSLLCDTFPEGDTNKCLLISDTKATTDQSSYYINQQTNGPTGAPFRSMDDDPKAAASPKHPLPAWMVTHENCFLGSL